MFFNVFYVFYVFLNVFWCFLCFLCFSMFFWIFSSVFYGFWSFFMLFLCFLFFKIWNVLCISTCSSRFVFFSCSLFFNFLFSDIFTFDVTCHWIFCCWILVLGAFASYVFLMLLVLYACFVSCLYSLYSSHQFWHNNDYKLPLTLQRDIPSFRLSLFLPPCRVNLHCLHELSAD